LVRRGLEKPPGAAGKKNTGTRTKSPLDFVRSGKGGKGEKEERFNYFIRCSSLKDDGTKPKEKRRTQRAVPRRLGGRDED